MGLQRAFTTGLSAALHRGDGRQEPAIVMASADLDEAAEGIMRSAFGFGGQKCSANSRVYVEHPVHDELVRLLVEKTERITLGDPLLRATWLGPLTDQAAVDRHQQAVAEARRDGTVFCGGERLDDGDLAAASTSNDDRRPTARRPSALSGTSSSRPSRPSTPWTRWTRPCGSRTPRLRPHGRHLQRDDAQVERFLEGIEAVSCTSTDGPVPRPGLAGRPAFGGWKGSGSTGKAALGPWYVTQFLREQSHTIVRLSQRLLGPYTRLCRLHTIHAGGRRRRRVLWPR